MMVTQWTLPVFLPELGANLAAFGADVMVAEQDWYRVIWLEQILA